MNRVKLAVLVLVSCWLAPPADAAPDLIAIGGVSGFDEDFAIQTAGPLENGVPGNRLGGLGSGLAYAGRNTFIALPDRGPNAVSYNIRWARALEAVDNNIGDFNMIDASTGLVIERDNGEGDARRGCNGPARPDCFNVPARFKRVYKIDLSQPDAEGFVRKVDFVDLLDIKDPEGKARAGSANGVFSFPFVTIENVDAVDADQIVVANDNNLPFSSGRAIGKNDDNEFILLRVPELLRAR